MRLERMYRMAPFMHHGNHIIDRTYSIHKDKRYTGFGQRAVIASRSLAYTAIQIQALHTLHHLQTVAKVRMQFAKHLNAFVQHLCAIGKRFQRLLIFRNRIHIVRS
ncbi:hypothetical protein FQZ97_1130580 [compost metagenome]